MQESKFPIIARRGGVILRTARDDDLPRIIYITVICYTPIHDSFLEVVGEDVYQGIVADPGRDWKAHKAQRVRETFKEHPGCVWVLEQAGSVFGFITYAVFPERKRAWIEENGILPEHRNQGWATFMLRHVLSDLRQRGIRVASVEVDLDDVHIAARRAYRAAGFDRHHHIAIYHQNLELNNPGSMLVEDNE